MPFFKRVEDVFRYKPYSDKSKQERQSNLNVVAVDAVPFKDRIAIGVKEVHQTAHRDRPDVHKDYFFPFVATRVVKPGQR